jgi:hypothetical protein
MIYYVGVITKQQYVGYLIFGVGDYMGSNHVEQLNDVSHDVIIDFLSRKLYRACGLWGVIEELIKDNLEASMLVNDNFISFFHSND